MAHINTGFGEHDHSVSAYIVRLDGDQPRMMLHLHKKLQMLMQFGGHIEKTETPWAAVLHETTEETGYSPSQLSIMQPKERIKTLFNSITHPYPLYHATFTFDVANNPLPGHFHTDSGYLFITNEDPASVPAEGEETNIVWMTAEEIATLTTKETFINVQQAAAFAFEQLNNWESVPATSIETKFTSI